MWINGWDINDTSNNILRGVCSNDRYRHYRIFEALTTFDRSEIIKCQMTKYYISCKILETS